jgi:hypothetical protein
MQCEYAFLRLVRTRGELLNQHDQIVLSLAVIRLWNP